MEMLEIHSKLKELLNKIDDNENEIDIIIYQNIYLVFRGLVVDASNRKPVYKHWPESFLLDVDDESGEVIKLHESIEELASDVNAFITLIDRNEQLVSKK
jgi:hypothetical protein